MNRSMLILALLILGLLGSGFSSTYRSIDNSPRNLIDNGAIVNPARNFDIQKLAERVYAVIRKDPPGLMVDANNVFIINDEDVIVIDANGAPSTTREVLAALRKLTDKPVKYVINTHWHDDHIIGDTVYREAFPNVEFIAHENMREYLPKQGTVNRKNFLENAPQALDFIKGLVAQNKGLSGNPLSEEERTSFTSDISLVDLVLKESAGTQLTLPTLVIKDRLTLHRGNRIIDIRYLGSGHTSGDIIVHLPQEGIVVTGDLVVWPVPLVGGDQSYVNQWSATLDQICALKPTTIVPGHGPVMHDDSYLKLMSELFANIKQQTEAAVARGEALEQVRKSINLDEFKKRFAGDSPVKKALFSTYVTGPAVTSAFRNTSAKK